MSSNPVLTGITLDNGAPVTFPMTIPANTYSPWMLAVGTDADAQAGLQAQLKLVDSTGRESNSLTIGTFNFPDPLEIASLTFPAGTPYQVETDPANKQRFRIKNTNAPA
jgi:hypothetical protein